MKREWVLNVKVWNCFLASSFVAEPVLLLKTHRILLILLCENRHLLSLTFNLNWLKCIICAFDSKNKRLCANKKQITLNSFYNKNAQLISGGSEIGTEFGKELSSRESTTDEITDLKPIEETSTANPEPQTETGLFGKPLFPEKTLLPGEAPIGESSSDRDEVKFIEK